MKRIGILTYFGDLNAGTNLQAYCTLKALEQCFPNDHIEIIDYHLWRDYKIPYIRGGVSLHTIINDIRRINEYSKFIKNQLNKSKKSLYSSDYNAAINFINSLGYDLIYVGADTILELHKVEDGITAYWLSPDVKSKKYLLAASARNITFDNLSKLQKEQIRNTINEFELCGVRDTSTYNLLFKFISDKNKLTLIPDPTFTLPIDYSYVENYIKQRKIDFEKPTVCFHLLKSEKWGNELAILFKNQGYQVVSFRPDKYSDYILNDLSPFEQLGIYKYFKLMITHRFHDTIFCLKNNTPMITYPLNDSYTTKDGDSKYYSLLNEFGLCDTNYIKQRSDISAKLIFNMSEKAIQYFNSNKKEINNKLETQKAAYYSFINLSK